MMEAQFAAWTLPLTALTTGFLGSVHCLGMCGGISATVALASSIPSARPLPDGVFSGAVISGAPRSSAVLGSSLFKGRLGGIGGAKTVKRSAQQAPIPLGPSLRSPPFSKGEAQEYAPPHPFGKQLIKATSQFATETNVLAFNAGRIGSYAIAGAMAGTLGGALAGVGQEWVISGTMPMRLALFVFANLMIIFTGLYLMGLPQLLAPLERAGGNLWKHLSPWSRRLLPLRSPAHAAMFGALWGWIPCGMVYAMLLTSMSAGSAASGAMTMLAFGVGTLPAMVAAGWSAGRLRSWTRNARVRLVAGGAVLAMGVFGLARLGTLEQLQSFGAFCTSLLMPAP